MQSALTGPRWIASLAEAPAGVSPVQSRGTSAPPDGEASDLGLQTPLPCAFPQKANDLESNGHDCAGGKALGFFSAELVVMLEYRPAQEAASLLLIYQELPNLFSQIIFGA